MEDRKIIAARQAQHYAEVKEQYIRDLTAGLWEVRKKLLQQDQLEGWRKRVSDERIKSIRIKTHFDDDDDRDGVTLKCPYCGKEEVMTDGGTVHMLRMYRREETYVTFDSAFLDQEDEPNLWFDWSESHTIETSLRCYHCDHEVAWPAQVDHA